MWCWRRLLRVPWTTRRSNQSILKEINPEYHWKDWYWSWNSNILATLCEELTHWKRPWCWGRLWQEERGMSKNVFNMLIGWHHWLNAHGFSKLGDSQGQGSLVCCSLWDCKESDTTKRLNKCPFRRLSRKSNCQMEHQPPHIINVSYLVQARVLPNQIWMPFWPTCGTMSRTLSWTRHKDLWFMGNSWE